MIEYVKKELLNNPDKIKELLETYDYCFVKIHSTYITCSRNSKSSPKSIVIRLENNEGLLVHDYAKNVIKDIFAYISLMRNVSFKDIFNTCKKILGIRGSYIATERHKAFGGFYEKITKQAKQIIETIDDSALNKYKRCPNQRFYKDGISIEAQRYFGIGYDIENQAITIPIRNEAGNLIGVKARRNDDEIEGNKYYYLIPTYMSQTLYGFSENYGYLTSGDVIVFESEKSCLQCFSFGVRNCVALGSSSLSKKQALLILSLFPKRIILAHDKSSDIDVIKVNAKTIMEYGRMREFKIYYVDMENDTDIPPKSSPSDLGVDKFNQIMNDYLVLYENE